MDALNILNRDLNDAAWDHLSGTTLPRARFFKPLDTFWSILSEIQTAYDIKMFIDCGTGNGDLPSEAVGDHKIKMAGIDIVAREGNSPCQVQIIPAHRMPTNEDIWPMVCRPDHSGWVYSLLEKALESGSGFIYVGLLDNMEQDLGDHLENFRFEMGRFDPQ